MSILEYLSASEYYASANPARMEPGHFCWIVSPYIDPIPRILSVERNNPEEHDSARFSLREANRQEDFKTSDRVLPVKNLNLRSNEELLTQRSKRRRGIILATNLDVDPDLVKLLKQRGKKHLHEPYFIVVPCYSTQTEDHGSGVPPEMTQRIQCLLYKQYFYCPELLKFNKDLRETVARIDRIQVVVGSSSHAIRGVGASLSEAAFAIFRAMVLFCLTGEEESELEDLRSLLREAYNQALSSAPLGNS
ncbi:MAG: hypothetical protein AB9866_02930 [Syntrophobacteraceae bacterium]